MHTIQDYRRVVIGSLLIAALLTACNSGGGATTPQPGPHVIGNRTKTSGCVSKNALPDSACSPGAAFSDVTKDQVCTPGYSKNVRNVPDSEKQEVFAEYRITSHGPGEY